MLTLSSPACGPGTAAMRNKRKSTSGRWPFCHSADVLFHIPRLGLILLSADAAHTDRAYHCEIPLCFHGQRRSEPPAAGRCRGRHSGPDVHRHRLAAAEQAGSRPFQLAPHTGRAGPAHLGHRHCGRQGHLCLEGQSAEQPMGLAAIFGDAHRGALQQIPCRDRYSDANQAHWNYCDPVETPP